ncbi:MAG TPA: hypothetical protein VFB62_12660 [Polyangiaceae bacterium]|nr:hypothetical protein [Polyangiaceae bacterium]
MRNLTAARFWARTLSGCVLASLLGCAAPKIVTKTVPVEIPVPVVKPLPHELTKDCEPRYRYPATDLTVEAVIDRLVAVEIALGICRNQLDLIRASSTP